jgi:hypothetical protein
VDGSSLDQVGQGDQGRADHVVGLLRGGLGATGQAGDWRIVVEEDNL